MAQDYSNRKLQRNFFKDGDLTGANFSKSDLRGADFSGSNLTGADFTQVKTGITPLNKALLFFFALVVSALSGYFAMLAGRTLQAMQASADENIRLAGYITVAVIILFILFSYWKGVGNSIYHLILPVVILALVIGAIAFFTTENLPGLGSGQGALYLVIALVLVSVMFIVGTIARVSAGTLSNIIFVFIALFGGFFGKTLGGGIGTVVLAISCALISKRALAGAAGFESLRKIAFFFTRKFGTSFRNAKLKNARFSGAQLHNTDFSQVDVSSVNWGDAKKINCITPEQHPTLSSEKNGKEDHPADLTEVEIGAESIEMAQERTLMAWIRTTISLTTFGFAIYKFFQEMETAPGAAERLLSPRAVGLIMIGFGFMGLLLGLIQHQMVINKLRRIKRLRGADFGIQGRISMSSVIAILILIYTLLLFLGALYRQ